MEKDERKVVYGIRGKLVSAVAMLLVACIMVVSSTYAWFTLSTAPEVTGISTAVGANGALEMMLSALYNGTFADGSEAQSNGDTNSTWGNLVNLADGTIIYGTQQITLYPSKLITTDGKLNRNVYLSFPKYGADGRPEKVLTGATVVGKYTDGAFYKDETGYGFRVVGSASGMTERQLAFRDAVSAVSVNMNRAVNAAKESLDEKVGTKSNGTILADIAMMKGMQDDPTFTQVHVSAINRMVIKLKVASGYIETAYVQALLAFAASSESGLTDDDFNAIKASVTDSTSYQTLRSAVVAKLASGVDSKLALFDYAYAKVTAMNTHITEAETKVAALTGDSLKWGDISPALTPLVEVTSVTVNNKTVAQIKEDPNSLISDYGAGKGLTVRMPTGSGVYADVSDQCGDYTTSIVLDTSTIGISMGGGVEVAATMATKTEITPVYIKGIMDGATYVTDDKGDEDETNDEKVSGVTISGKSPATGSTQDMPLTEFYGYIIDLTFRTNAPQASLLLSEATDRIYSDNNNEATMGHGSTMTFKSDDTTFSEDKVKDLMGHIRIVFFETGLGATGSTQENILAYGKLDIENATKGVNGVTANMYISVAVDNAFEYTYEVTENGSPVTKKVVLFEKTETTPAQDGGQDTTVTKYYTDVDCTKEFTEVTVNKTEQNSKVVTEIKDNKITSLNQNVAKQISALVYLDGTTIQNSDVAATATQSMYGTVNFQFKTDAPLVPMEYADLHTPNTPSTNN